MMFSFCACGHERDEHDEQGYCVAADEHGEGECPCIYFEEDPDAGC